jgi:hypothetical protein
MQAQLRLSNWSLGLPKWALAWSPYDTLVLYSPDIGTLSYDVRTGRIFGRQVYERKYGKRPKG